jgi:hypothetical protein
MLPLFRYGGQGPFFAIEMTIDSLLYGFSTESCHIRENVFLFV